MNTLKTPQSSTLETNEAPLSPRELAKLAISCVQTSERWRTEEGPVLVYPDGTRTRSGRLGPFLKAVSRYVRAAPELLIVPVCVVGTDRLFPMDERLYPQPVQLLIGEPFPAADAGRGKTAVLQEARARLIALGRLTGLIITISMFCSVRGRECADVGKSLTITTTATISKGRKG